MGKAARKKRERKADYGDTVKVPRKPRVRKPTVWDVVEEPASKPFVTGPYGSLPLEARVPPLTASGIAKMLGIKVAPLSWGGISEIPPYPPWPTLKEELEKLAAGLKVTATSYVGKMHGTSIYPTITGTATKEPPMDFTVNNASWETIDLALQHVERVLLIGRPGTGKTSTAIAKLREMGYATYTMSLTEGDFSQSIFGRDKLDGKGGMYFESSKAVDAIRAAEKGSRAALVLNEINRASLEVLSALYPICDVGPGTEVLLPNKEILKLGPNFRIVATMNGHLDELPEGLRGRFPVCFNVVEASPVVLRGLPPELAKLATNPTPADKGAGVRTWHAFHALSQKLSEEKAAQILWGDGYKSVLDSIKVART